MRSPSTGHRVQGIEFRSKVQGLQSLGSRGSGRAWGEVLDLLLPYKPYINPRRCRVHDLGRAAL